MPTLVGYIYVTADAPYIVDHDLMCNEWSWEYELKVVLAEMADLETQIQRLREYLVYVEGMIET